MAARLGAAHRLYAILPDDPARVVGVARRLYGLGCRLFQLRLKGAAGPRLARARELREALPEARLIINDDAAVAQLCGDGVHLGRDDLPVASARLMLGRARLVGATAHDVGEALEAVEAGADHLGVGTVYASPTKPERPAAGLDLLRAVVAATSVPVFAIGGITVDRAAEVLATGVFGLALGSGLERAGDRAVEALVRRLAQHPAKP